MSYTDRLVQEINAKLDKLAAESKPWTASWVAHAVCGDHTDGLATNDESQFWRHCGYAAVREEVRRCINKRAGDQPERRTAQLSLPGYDHLQNYYMVNRGGDEVGVPVHALTDAELEGKATRYRAMGEACYAHADEIDRYRRNRGRQVQASATVVA